MKQVYRRIGVSAFALIACAGLAAEATAQTVRAVISSTSGAPPITFNFAQGQPITIDVSGIDAPNETTLVRIFDPVTVNGVPDSDVGLVTIQRDYNSPVGLGRLNVLVADESETAMPGSGSAPLFRGLRDFGGLRVIDLSSGVETQDVTSVVAVSALRDVTGPITAGVIRRVDAARNISGNLLGVGRGNNGAIDTVRAGNLISGNLTTELNPAAGTNTFSSYINRVTVDAAGAAGITGNIRSASNIRFILTSGPIGPSTPGGPLPVIEAANTIYQIRCVESIDGQPVLRPIAAIIKAGTRYDNPDDPAPNNALYQALSRPTAEDPPGSIRQIEASRLDGSVDALTIGVGSSEINGITGRPGILIRGPITAPINVLLNVYYCDIIASTITAPITIGWRLTGSIVAYGEPTPKDPTLGRIARVTVGRLATPPTNWAENYLDGFGSSEAGLVLTDTGASDAQGTPGTRSREDVWFSPLFTCGGGGVPVQQTIDSTIFAHSAGTIDLSKMTSQLSGAGAADPATKSLKPRIEVQTVDELRIDAMESGVVWSGLLEYETDSQTGLRVLRNDPSNDYAAVASAGFGCVSPSADVYMRQCPLVVVGGDVLGEFHLPALAAGETIRIGGKLGAHESRGA